MVAKQQQNERKATRFDGVYQRTSRMKKYEGKPDVTYTIDYYDPHTGKRIRKTIGNRSQGITAEYANSVRQGLLSKAKKEALSGILPNEVTVVPTLGAAWERYNTDWLEGHDKACAYGDLTSYNRHLKDHPLHSKPLHRISVADLEAFTAQKRREGYAAQSIKNLLALIRRVMKKAMVWKLWNGPIPFAEFAMPVVNNERTRYLTETEAKVLLEKIKARDEKTWLISLLSLHCGLRFGEIARLEQRDLDFENNIIFIRLAKNGHSRYAVMTQTLKTALMDWVNGLPTPRLFPGKNNQLLCGVGRAFGAAVKEMKLNEGVTDTRDLFVFHSLRHSFASFLAKSGYGQSVIAELLGHRSLEMTKRYTHFMPDTRKAAANALDRIIGMEHQESPQ